MPESSLSITIADIAAAIGNYLGFSRTAANWQGWSAAAPYVPQAVSVVLPSGTVTVGAGDTQLGQIIDCINSGLRNFYNAPMVDPAAVAHKWSFMTQEATISIQAGQSYYDLPDLFASMSGDMNFQAADNVWHTIRRVGIQQVRDHLQREFGITSKPMWCAVVPKPSDGVLGQRFQLVIAPIPDQNYTPSYSFEVQPAAITAQAPYLLGGAQHGETILESCLAVAEVRYQDEESVHRNLFKERLMASISQDVRDFKPEFLGYNRDASRQRNRARGFGMMHDLDTDLVTYYGMVPGQ